MEYILARRELRNALEIGDPSPVDSVQKMWTSAGQTATIGIFLILFGAFLYVGRAILLPILAAAVIALTLAPMVKSAKRFGISPWITGLLILLVAVGGVSLAVTTLAGPVSEWIGRAPEIGASIKQKLSVFDQPLAALQELENTLFGGDTTLKVSAPAANYVLPVVAFLTPAAGELLLFFATLFFFLVGQIELRSQLVSMFGSRDAKLRFLKIMRDVEHNLAGYLSVVTIVNAAVGAIVALGAWFFGFPDPIMFGLLAAVLNYVPYIGPALMVLVLFGVSLITFASLGRAMVAPLAFVALTAMEGHFITPMIVGRRFTLNPLLVFLAIAFWTWMWGPFGAFLAAPLSIILLVVVQHLFPIDDVRLPE